MNYIKIRSCKVLLRNTCEVYCCLHSKIKEIHTLSCWMQIVVKLKSCGLLLKKRRKNLKTLKPTCYLQLFKKYKIVEQFVSMHFCVCLRGTMYNRHESVTQISLVHVQKRRIRFFYQIFLFLFLLNAETADIIHLVP